MNWTTYCSRVIWFYSAILNFNFLISINYVFSHPQHIFSSYCCSFINYIHPHKINYKLSGLYCRVIHFDTFLFLCAQPHYWINLILKNLFIFNFKLFLKGSVHQINFYNRFMIGILKNLHRLLFRSQKIVIVLHMFYMHRIFTNAYSRKSQSQRLNNQIQFSEFCLSRLVLVCKVTYIVLKAFTLIQIMLMHSVGWWVWL